jgi:hypothetical protein
MQRVREATDQVAVVVVVENEDCHSRYLGASMAGARVNAKATLDSSRGGPEDRSQVRCRCFGFGLGVGGCVRTTFRPRLHGAL